MLSVLGTSLLELWAEKMENGLLIPWGREVSVGGTVWLLVCATSPSVSYSQLISADKEALTITRNIKLPQAGPFPEEVAVEPLKQKEQERT